MQEQGKTEEDDSVSSSFVENEQDSDHDSDEESLNQSQKQESKSELPRIGGKHHHSLKAISDDDKYAIIQDWLFQGMSHLISENLPYFSSSELVKTWILLDTDLKMFYRLITSPFEIPMHRTGIVKYGKYKKRLNVKFKLTNKTKPVGAYIPAKHNAFYFRSRKMLYTIMYRANTSMLQTGNPYFISTFCSVLCNQTTL